MERHPDVRNPVYLVTASPEPPPAPGLLYKAEQLVETRWLTLRRSAPKEGAEAKLIQRAHWASRGLSACRQPGSRGRGVSLIPAGRRATCYRLTTSGGGVVDRRMTVHLEGRRERRLAANIYMGHFILSSLFSLVSTCDLASAVPAPHFFPC